MRCVVPRKTTKPAQSQPSAHIRTGAETSVADTPFLKTHRGSADRIRVTLRRRLPVRVSFTAMFLFDNVKIAEHFRFSDDANQVELVAQLGQQMFFRQRSYTLLIADCG